MVILWVNRCLVAASRPSLWVRCSRVTPVAMLSLQIALDSVKAVFFRGCFNLNMDPLKMYFHVFPIENGDSPASYVRLPEGSSLIGQVHIF